MYNVICIITYKEQTYIVLPRWLGVENPPVSARDTGDTGLIPRLGRSPGEGNGKSLTYSCLEKSHGQRSLAGHSLTKDGLY